MAAPAAAPRAPVTIPALARLAGNGYQSTWRMVLGGRVKVPTVVIGPYVCIPADAVSEAVRQIRKLTASRPPRS